MEDAYVPASSAFHKMTWPASIPCDVIVSDKTPFPPLPELKIDTDRWRQAHVEFAKRAPKRWRIVAKGRSHDVAHDRPDMILDAVGHLLDRVRSGNSGPANGQNSH